MKIGSKHVCVFAPDSNKQMFVDNKLRKKQETKETVKFLYFPRMFGKGIVVVDLQLQFISSFAFY